MDVWISAIALIFAVLCFGIYFYVTVALIPAARKKAGQVIERLAGPDKGLVGVSAKDIAEVVKALASLTDSLVKAGPALWSLIGSVLFLLIASLAAGLIISAPERAPSPNANTAVNSTANETNAVDKAADRTAAGNENLKVH